MSVWGITLSQQGEILHRLLTIIQILDPDQYDTSEKLRGKIQSHTKGPFRLKIEVVQSGMNLETTTLFIRWSTQIMLLLENVFEDCGYKSEEFVTLWDSILPKSRRQKPSRYQLKPLQWHLDRNHSSSIWPHGLDDVNEETIAITKFHNPKTQGK